MALPPPGKSVYWKDYQNETPTFRLTPVDKPDMSPYLIHMTGKKAIKSILEGKERPGEEHKEAQGYLKSSVPEFAKYASDGEGGVFDAKVVCLSESPTFSIDYFRYRSFDRWRADLRFGIGFHKDKMVERGVRPVLYLDSALTKQVISLRCSLHKSGNKAPKDPADKDRLMKLVDSVYPLAFPLLEDHENQGFMWEREWRYPKADGLVFDHSEIAVICCPPEEESGIRSILGVAVSRINFVRTWEEYDDVTDYLNRQQEVWASKRRGERMETTLEFRLKQLDEEIQERKIAANHLESYADVISQMAKEAKRAEEQRTRLLDDVQALQKEKAILVKRQAKAQAGEPADEESDEDEE